MGVAAYNRGTKALADQLDREQPEPDLTLLRDLTAVSAKSDGPVPFAATVIRFDSHTGEACLMNRQRGGWGASCRAYRSVWVLARRWRLAFVGFGRDEHSRFINVVPFPSTRKP